MEHTHRSFGDVNIITCADFWHLHQVSGTSFASNPMDESTGYAHHLLDIFRHSSKDSVRSLQALTELMLFLEQQCRVGVLGCQDYRLFHERTMLTSLCSSTKTLESQVQISIFSSVPFLYSFNVAQCLSSNVHASDIEKQKNGQLTWCYTRNEPLHAQDQDLPKDKSDRKLLSCPRRHDRKAVHLPSVYPLEVGMAIKLTERVDRGMPFHRGCQGVIHGWTMAGGCSIDGEFSLDSSPQPEACIFGAMLWDTLTAQSEESMAQC